MENELIITRDIVEKYENKFIENDDRKFVVDTFNEVFPHGAKISEMPKLIPELDDDYPDFVDWLLQQVPPTDTPVVVDTLQDSIVHNGDVIVKGDVIIDDNSEFSIYIKGKIKFEGKLEINTNQIPIYVNINKSDT
ncbi:hypothetical protein [Snodgrassella alvi]|uniref:hypothetical protein n=1 Tax=Snodgrassella alvi TaxID=1196083 RepID=UPI000C1E990B|nr:hypothetical protein [Snodgrassella alvi]PIT32627.1 hypothetical protein BHC42_07455 [Snodgrassella alvi]PIT33021.1 hypothetical protein BHC50_04405 [Snodgrassella alvi]PIT34111.1 hypothetical protein BHC50_04080 [Snodgrassella alvi]PIT34958.1 hypothetical protein BHC50_00855 [Snodgrassella alvi]WLT03705.1 hypothetical protein RAM23_07795 [Snodgrassella alvi]